MSTAVLEAPATPEPQHVKSPVGIRRARRIAIVAGLLGTLFAVATPFLPVVMDTTTMDWPQDGRLLSVNAPLMSQVPIDINATIPCSVVDRLPAGGGVLLALAPPDGTDASLESMKIRATPAVVEAVDRDVVVASIPRTKRTGCTSITFSSDNRRTVAIFNGAAAGGQGTMPHGQLNGDLRPQVVGVFSDLSGPAPAGLSFHMTVDSRFTSHPSLLKRTSTIAALVCTIVALVALAMLDGTDGRRHRRVLPAHWLRPTALDGVVLAILGFWHFAGASTSDDGYILTMARTAPHAGYMANYFRWFGVPEAPFGWYYNIIEEMAKVSTASPWVRLPALSMAIVCWMVISREVAPRLGRGVGSNKVALWTGAMVFLTFWLPYNNGLRPEPIVALGSLLTWCSVERAIGTGRLLPAAMACLIGAFTLAAAPTGLNCVVALLVGLQPLVRIVVRRRREVGPLALLAPIASAGFLVLTVVYGAQTFTGIQEADRVRQFIGPNIPWYQDFLRYYWLFIQSVDGSLSRRFAFLIMLLCLFTMLLMMLRRRRIPGIAAAPTWRLMGVIFGSIFLMMFNPTKYTHHFGAYAGTAGALGTVTAVAVSRATLRSVRNRTVFVAALMFVLAVTFSGINGYWYVSSFGVPWFDKPVSLHGINSNTVFLGLMGLALLALGRQYLREGCARPDSERKRMKRMRFGSIPLTLVAGFMVAFEVLSLLKGAIWQYPAYSLARSNLAALAGNTCGLANDVLVETDPNADRLTPFVEPGHPWRNPKDPLAGENPRNFTPNGIPDDLSADAAGGAPGHTDNTMGPTMGVGANAGTEGGTTSAPGVNGSHAKLPYGLDPRTTPVLGSYAESGRQPGSVTSAWYALPARSADSPLIVIAAAGRIASTDRTGQALYGQPLTLEYGKRQANGNVRVEGDYQPKDIGPAPAWRDLRVPFSGITADADAVRIVASNPVLSTDQWLAFTPPRVPKLTTLNQVVGHTQPVMIDWVPALQFPCQKPFYHHDGVAEAPRYRIKPDRTATVVDSYTWQNENDGGIDGWADMLADSVTMPAYLKDDWGRDWGTLERYLPYYKAVPAKLHVTQTTRSGFWSPGRMRVGKGL